MPLLITPCFRCRFHWRSLTIQTMFVLLIGLYSYYSIIANEEDIIINNEIEQYNDLNDNNGIVNVGKDNNGNSNNDIIEFVIHSKTPYPVLFCKLVGYKDNDHTPVSKFVYLGNGVHNNDEHVGRDIIDEHPLSPLRRIESTTIAATSTTKQQQKSKRTSSSRFSSSSNGINNQIRTDENGHNNDDSIFAIKYEFGANNFYIPKGSRDKDQFHEVIRYDLSVRIEYSSYNTSLANYPTSERSFMGINVIDKMPLSKLQVHELILRDNYSKQKKMELQQSSSSFGPWFVRQHSDNLWTTYYYDDADKKSSKGHYMNTKCNAATTTTSFWNEQSSDKYNIVIIGDSQPNYMCKQMISSLSSSSSSPGSVKCELLKGNWTDYNKQEKGLKDFSIEYSKNITQNAIEMLNNTNDDNKMVKNIIIFNTQGLWEVAYGQIESTYESMFTNVIDSIYDFLLGVVDNNGSSNNNNKNNNNIPYFYFLETTSVHPYHYHDAKSPSSYSKGVKGVLTRLFRGKSKPDIYTDKKKWSMTQTRVHLLNDISKRIVLEQRHKRSFHGEEQQEHGYSHIEVIDMIEDITLLSDEDPMESSDMRHYGTETNDLLLSNILCQINYYQDQQQ